MPPNAGETSGAGPPEASLFSELAIDQVLDALPLWIWVVDASGQVRFRNRKVREEIPAPDLEPEPQAGFGTAALVREGWVRDIHGKLRWLQLRRLPLALPAGGAALIGLDQTAQHLAELDKAQIHAALEAFLEHAPFAVVGSDQTGSIRVFNHAAECFFGCSRSAILGSPVEGLLCEQTPGAEDAPVRRIRALRGDGSAYEGFVRQVMVPLPEGNLRVDFVSADNPVAAWAGDRQFRALSANLVTILDDERRRIAQHIHDSLNQRIAVLVMELAALGDSLADPPEPARQLLAQLSDNLVELSEDMRQVAHTLHPPALDFLGLGPALESACASFELRHGIPCVLRLDQVPPDIPRQTSICLYRITEDCFREIARQGSAKEILVAVSGAGDWVRLTLADAGGRLEEELVSRPQGLGSLSVRERVSLAGGTVSFVRDAEAGTALEIWIPFGGRTDEPPATLTGR